MATWESEQFPLVEGAKELKAASHAFGEMFGIPTFHEFDRAWREVLHHLERAWNKLVAECEGRKNWPKLKSKYEHLRKTDPLLKYVIHARNVSEHTIAQVVQDWNPNLRVSSVPGGTRIEWDEWDRPLLPVVNRGTRFNPPKSHLGKPMQHYRVIGVSEPRTVAELAITFYVEAFNEVSKEVFPGGRW